MYVSVELEASRRCVCKAAYPHVRHYEDVRAIDRKEVEEWRNSFPPVRVVIAGGGFPCRDMSRLRGHCRLGVQGPQSGLVVHLPRIWDLVKKVWPTGSLREFAENVASSALKDVLTVNRILGTTPWQLDGGDVSWAGRDRLFCCDWTIIPCDATVVRQEAHCTVLKFKVNKGPCSHWLDRGARWPGEATGQFVPTLVRHVPRKKPPWDPRGIHRCSEVAKQRWAAARWP